MGLDIGRTGLVVLVVLFVILAVEDLVAWVTTRTVPGVEFFLAFLLILVVFLYTIRTARRSTPHPDGGNDD